jgi:exopolysaccharide biosynthesis protein
MLQHRLRLALLLLILSCVELVLAQTTEHPFRGITHITRVETTPRSVTMHIVLVDLSSPGIRFKLTGPSGTRETVRQTTLAFLTQERAQVAINAHFFLPFPSTDPNAEVIGLAASEGKAYSACEKPVQSFALVENAPAINIDGQNRASIVHCGENARLWNTLAGSAQIVTDGVVTLPVYKDAAHPSGTLTADGQYSNEHSWYDLPRARTAIGLTRDSLTLVLFTVEAGRSGEAAGMSVGEVANLLVKDYGVYNALNLDGGGSTSLAIDGRMVTSGTREVASSLAIFAER